MKPERPPLIWFDGAIRPWHEATVHVWSELATRGANVFEGIRCYRRSDGSFHGLDVDRHLRRLADSAALLRIPVPYPVDELRRAIADLTVAIGGAEHLYLRPTVYLAQGRLATGADAEVGAYVVAVPVPRDSGRGVRCCVSGWRRASDQVFPPRIKSGAAYLMFRLPLLEARERGCDEAILLNDAGMVGEATGANVMLVKNGRLLTPPVSAGILPGITRDNLMTMAREDLGIEVEERDITRAELYLADEVLLCGTLCEVEPVLEIDGRVVGDGTPGPVSGLLRDHYRALCDGDRPDRRGWLTAQNENITAARETEGAAP
ncbi:aminotransferase class IV [Nocardia takedensis]